MAAQKFTQAEALAFVGKYLGDLVAIEGYTARWRTAVFQLATAGAASCGMIKAYNAGALGFWSMGKDGLEAIHKAAAGTPIETAVRNQLPPYPPEPTLLGSGMTIVNGLKTVTLDCISNDALMDPSRLRMFGSRPGWPCLLEDTQAGTTLREPATAVAVAAGVCAGGPQALGCLIWGGIAIGLGSVAYLIISKMADALISLNADRINLERAKADYKNNALAAEHVRDCVALYIAKGGDPAKLADIRKACELEAQKLFRRSDAPYASGWAGLLWGLAAVVGVTGVVYVAVRASSRKDAYQAQRRARAGTGTERKAA